MKHEIVLARWDFCFSDHLDRARSVGKYHFGHSVSKIDLFFVRFPSFSRSSLMSTCKYQKNETESNWWIDYFKGWFIVSDRPMLHVSKSPYAWISRTIDTNFHSNLMMKITIQSCLSPCLQIVRSYQQVENHPKTEI